jgi:hypothetical protein
MLLPTTHFPPLFTPVLPSAMEHNTECESPKALSSEPLSMEEKAGNSDDTRPSEVPSTTAITQIDDLPILSVNQEAVKPTPPMLDCLFCRLHK